MEIFFLQILYVCGFFSQLERKFPSSTVCNCLPCKKRSIKMSIMILSTFSSHCFNHVNSHPLHDCSWLASVNALSDLSTDNIYYHTNHFASVELFWPKHLLVVNRMYHTQSVGKRSLDQWCTSQVYFSTIFFKKVMFRPFLLILLFFVCFVMFLCVWVFFVFLWSFFVCLRS